MYQSAVIRDVTYSLEEEVDTWLVEVTVYLETISGPSVVKGYLSMELVGLTSLKWVVECKSSEATTDECVQSQSFRIPKVNITKKSHIFTLKYILLMYNI